MNRFVLMASAALLIGAPVFAQEPADESDRSEETSQNQDADDLLDQVEADLHAGAEAPGEADVVADTDAETRTGMDQVGGGDADTDYSQPENQAAQAELLEPEDAETRQARSRQGGATSDENGLAQDDAPTGEEAIEDAERDGEFGAEEAEPVAEAAAGLDMADESAMTGAQVRSSDGRPLGEIVGVGQIDGAPHVLIQAEGETSARAVPANQLAFEAGGQAATATLTADAFQALPPQ